MLLALIGGIIWVQMVEALKKELQDDDVRVQPPAWVNLYGGWLYSPKQNQQRWTPGTDQDSF